MHWTATREERNCGFSDVVVRYASGRKCLDSGVMNCVYGLDWAGQSEICESRQAGRDSSWTRDETNPALSVCCTH